MRGLPGAIDVEKFAEVRFDFPILGSKAVCNTLWKVGSSIRDQCDGRGYRKRQVKPLSFFSPSLDPHHSFSGEHLPTEHGRSFQGIFVDGLLVMMFVVFRYAFERRLVRRSVSLLQGPLQTPETSLLDGPCQEKGFEARSPETGQVEDSDPNGGVPQASAYVLWYSPFVSLDHACQRR
jgi:hypothetical protein